MNKTVIIEKGSIILPCIAGFLCILSLFLIGWAAPVFMKMYRDFGIDPLPPHLRVISLIHWFWTLPLGAVVAGGLIWSSRRWSRNTTLSINIAAMTLAILVFTGFVFTLFQPIFGPMRTMQKTAEPTSAGDVATRAAPEK
jgi:hypothetical protein